MHAEPDTIDDDIVSSYEPEIDPIAQALNATGFVGRYTVDECVEQFVDTRVSRFPETFDRFYFDGPHGRVLIDLLEDGTPEQLAEERIVKHVAFKTAWCEDHDWQYLPIAVSDVTTEKIRRILDGTPEPQVSRPASQRAKTPGKRGQIQRPKAVE